MPGTKARKVSKAQGPGMFLNTDGRLGTPVKTIRAKTAGKKVSTAVQPQLEHLIGNDSRCASPVIGANKKPKTNFTKAPKPVRNVSNSSGDGRKL